jgi:hypothetical protein
MPRGKLDWREELCRLRIDVRRDADLIKAVAGGVDGLFAWVTFSYVGGRVITMTTGNGLSWECVVPEYAHGPAQVGDNAYLCVTNDIRELHALLKENAGLRLVYSERDDAFTVWFGEYNSLGGVRFTRTRKKLHRSSEGTLSVNMQSLRDIAGSLRESISELERRVQALAAEGGLYNIRLSDEDLRDLYPFDMEAAVLASEGFLREVRDVPRGYRAFRC